MSLLLGFSLASARPEKAVNRLGTSVSFQIRNGKFKIRLNLHLSMIRRNRTDFLFGIRPHGGDVTTKSVFDAILSLSHYSTIQLLRLRNKVDLLAFHGNGPNPPPPTRTSVILKGQDVMVPFE